jgi:hypothetical protein
VNISSISPLRAETTIGAATILYSNWFYNCGHVSEDDPATVGLVNMRQPLAPSEKSGKPDFFSKSLAHRSSKLC